MSIKYKWLAGRLKELILSDMERGIEKLPSESDLCARYKVSRQTVRTALALLEQSGLIEKRRGSGTYITGLSPVPGRNTIAVLLHSLQEYIYPALLEEISGVLGAGGFSIVPFATGSQHSKERQILQELLKNPPRAVLVQGCKSALPNPNLELYRRLIRQGTQLQFLFSFYPALPNSLYLKEENAGGAALLVRHLAEQGHSSIAGLFKADELQGLERFQGFSEALTACGLPLSDDHAGWYTTRQLGLLARRRDTSFLREFIRDSLPGCTAVICQNDFLAYFLIQELRRAGYSLPGSLALASFDNTYLSEALALTSLSRSPYQMGRLAGEMLLEKLKGLPAAPREIPWKLHIRESTHFSR